MALFANLSGAKFFKKPDVPDSEYLTALKAELYQFLTGKYFVFGIGIGTGNDLKSFNQGSELKKLNPKDVSGRCFGFSVDWIRRQLLNKKSYFDGASDAKVLKRTAKVKELHSLAGTYGLATFGHQTTVGVLFDDDDFNRRMGTISRSYSGWRKDEGRPESKGSPGFERLKYAAIDNGSALPRISKENVPECFGIVAKYYQQALSHVKDNQGMLIHFTHKSSKKTDWNANTSGHAMAAVRKSSSILFFDPNQGQTQWSAEDAGPVSQAIAGLWLVDFWKTDLMASNLVTLKTAEELKKEQAPDFSRMSIDEILKAVGDM